MRFLVLGGSGMAGHMIASYLSDRGYDVQSASRRPSPLGAYIPLDVHNRDELSRVLVQGEYDIVVNAVGILNQNAENDKSSAVYVNSLLPHMLADLTSGMRTRVIHMSTDCVFAGNSGPYNEESIPDGRSFYDRTKALGELVDGKNLTLRNSVIGPDVNPKGIGLVNWFMAQADSIQGYSNALWTGMTTLELSKAIEAVALDGTTGLVNMVPEGNISKLDLLKLLNHHLRNDELVVVPESEPVIDKTLVRNNYGSTFRPAGYEQQVSELAEWMRRHASLYPHYRIGQAYV